MALTPYSTNDIRTQLKSYLDGITGAELYAGYVTKPSQLTDNQVPTYYLEVGGSTTVSSEKTYQYYTQLWNVVVVYDDPQDTTSIEAIDKLTDYVRVYLASRTQQLNNEIEFLVPDSLQISEEQDIQIGEVWYVSRSFTVAVRVHDTLV